MSSHDLMSYATNKTTENKIIISLNDVNLGGKLLMPWAERMSSFDMSRCVILSLHVNAISK